MQPDETRVVCEILLKPTDFNVHGAFESASSDIFAVSVHVAHLRVQLSNVGSNGEAERQGRPKAQGEVSKSPAVAKLTKGGQGVNDLVSRRVGPSRHLCDAVVDPSPIVEPPEVPPVSLIVTVSCTRPKSPLEA